MNLDWNIVAEIVLGVIIYKIVDSLFNASFKIIRKVFDNFIK